MTTKYFLPIIILSLLLFAAVGDSTPSVRNAVVSQGDVLVYQKTTEVQDENGNATAFSPHMGETRVKREVSRSSETVEDVDDGLLYGFPLRAGLQWGGDPQYPRDDHMYCNYVEKIEDVTVAAGTFKDCFKIVEDTLPATYTEWYCPGAGIVKYEYIHHGTVINEWYELVSIQR